MMLQWNEMGVRERLFAAMTALKRGLVIQDAIDRVQYEPRSDTIYFGNAISNDAVRVDREGAYCVEYIRALLPSLFTSDQAVLNTVAVEGELRCLLDCGHEPHPGRPCGVRS